MSSFFSRKRQKLHPPHQTPPQTLKSPLRRIPPTQSSTCSSLLTRPPNPSHQHPHHLCLLERRKGLPLRHLPPLLHAPTATHCRGMHGFKCGMTAHRRLPTIIVRKGRRQTLSNEVRCMLFNHIPADPFNVRSILGRQMKSTPKLRAPQTFKRLLNRHTRPCQHTRLQVRCFAYPLCIKLPLKISSMSSSIRWFTKDTLPLTVHHR